MILSMRGEGELKLSKLNICQNVNITDLGFENVSILSWYSGGPVYNYLHELYIPASRDRNRDDRMSMQKTKPPIARLFFTPSEINI